MRFAFLCVLALLGGLAHAADPQSYKVEFVPVGNGEIDDTLESSSDLQALRKSAPVSPFGLIARARSDVDRLKTVIESFGYYQSRVSIKINGTLISNPGLGETLTALAKGTDATVSISVTLGPLYHLRHIDVEGDLPDADRSKLNLSPGEPAVAATVLAGAARLLSSLQEEGYAFATVDPPVAYESAHSPEIDLKFHVVAGQRVKVGRIHIEGLVRVREPLIRRTMLLKTGTSYSPSAVERTRRDLLALGVFGTVNVDLGKAADDTGGVPITFKTRERLRHAVTVNAAFSSDLGGSGGVTWADRNVFGNAEQLNVKASVINLGGSNTTGIGYDTSVTFLKPEFRERNQSLQFSVGAIKQSLQAYDQTAHTTGVTLIRKLSSIWAISAGLSTADERITQEALVNVNGIVQPARVTRFYTLFASPIVVSYDSTDLNSPLDDPRHGMRGSLSVTPTLALGHPGATFLINVFKLSEYFDLEHLVRADPGRTVLAVRALAGIAQGAGEYSLPPDQRFYGGGSGTIRGYAYQAVGPQVNGIPIGGTAITAGSLELRQRFGASLGAAFFVDAGHVSASLKAAAAEFRVGVGVGVRYFTAIGPIRLDVAVPTQRRRNDGAFQVYIGLGQAF